MERIYWSSVEYTHAKGTPEYESLKGGYVYAFMKAQDAREALAKLQAALQQYQVHPKDIEFISPYDQATPWGSEELAQHYRELSDKAGTNGAVAFDTFYAYE